MRRLLLAAARRFAAAYPARWRRRYGEELDELIVEMRLHPRDLFDLARWAIRTHVAPEERGRDAMTDRQFTWISRGLGLASLVVAAPAALFVVLSVLRYNFGVVDESQVWWLEHSSAALTMLGYLGAPVIALGLALLGMGRVSYRREGGALMVTARVRPSRLTLLAAAVSLFLIAVILGYGITENL